MITFKHYAEWRTTTDLPSTNLGPGVYPALGLAGETGEVLEKIKKLYRDRNGEADQAWRDELSKELGDCLWYIDRIANDFGFDLEDVALANISKLESRMTRGVLSGDGDNR